MCMSRWTECLYWHPQKLCCNWCRDLQR